MKQIIFKESPVARNIAFVVSFVAIFICTTIFLADDHPIFYWALNIGIFASFLIMIIFGDHTTIICDEFGCTVKRKIFWQKSGESYSFKWLEVSETEYVADGEYGRKFYLEIDGVKREIVSAEASLDDFDYFIRTVNSATPHLPYIWEKGDGWINRNFDAKRYKRVSR